MHNLAAALEPENKTPLVQINRFFLLFILLGMLAAVLSPAQAKHGATVVLWACACLSVGAFVGLLFGIPRMRQRSLAGGDEGKDAGAKYQPEINNNLIEVSDWLTKIIVGVGLVQLTSLPAKMKLVAQPLALCLGERCGLAVAVGVIVYFTAAGFLAGYINARTFVAVMFRKSDDQLLDQVTQLKTQLRQTAAVHQAQQVETEVKNEGIRELLANQMPAVAAVATEGELPAGPDAELTAMAEDYRRINHPDQAVRVRRKELAASQMLRYIIKNKIPRAALYSWVQAEPADGLIVALASLSIAAPVEGDVGPLLAVADKADWLHAKYRVTLALCTLFRAGHGTPAEWERGRKLMVAYRAIAAKRHDESLDAVAAELITLITAKLSHG